MTVRYLNRTPLAPVRATKGANSTITDTTRTFLHTISLPASSPQMVVISYCADSQLQSGSTNVVLIQSCIMQTPQNAANGVTTINTAAGSIERELPGSLLWAAMGPRVVIGRSWLFLKPEEPVNFSVVGSHNGTGTSAVLRTHTELIVTPGTSSTAFRELGI